MQPHPPPTHYWLVRLQCIAIAIVAMDSPKMLVEHEPACKDSQLFSSIDPKEAVKTTTGVPPHIKKGMLEVVGISVFLVIVWMLLLLPIIFYHLPVEISVSLFISPSSLSEIACDN